MKEDQLQVMITDLSGKILFQKIVSSLLQIEIGRELPAGFYLVEVKGKLSPGDSNCEGIKRYTR
jgi:hypothetical protein